MIRITYKKKNGEIIERYLNTGYTLHRVGDTNRYDWEIIDIKYKYKNKYYTLSDYDRIITKKWNKDKKRYQMNNKIKIFYQNVNHMMSFLILLRIFTIITNKAYTQIFLGL